MLTDLPQDILILVCMHMLVEDVLALMQTCRVLHALGSLDYLWHRLLSDWDIPLDIPENTSLASLPSTLLRAAAVRSLKLDSRWRNPRAEMRHVHRIISSGSSFIDGMCLLPGGRWLVTLQYERMTRTRTRVALWSVGDTNCRSIFSVTVFGRVRYLQAHRHHELEKITIGIVFTRGVDESIHIYDVFLQGNSSAHSLVFEATPPELDDMGCIAGMKMNGEIMIAVFASSEGQAQLMCVNLVSGVATVLECPVWSFGTGQLRIFRQYFAVTTSDHTPQCTTAHISFYKLPPVLGVPGSPTLSAPCWPESLVIKSSLIASTSWCSDDPVVLEFSDDTLTDNTEACSFTVFGYSIRMQTDETRRIDLLRVSFDGSNIVCFNTVVPCRSVPSGGDVRVSPSGRRAVWLTPGPDVYEYTLMKFALERTGKGTGSCISTLMPSFSGWPFNPRDFNSFVFDEISCKMAVGLPSGELYILHF